MTRRSIIFSLMVFTFLSATPQKCLGQNQKPGRDQFNKAPIAAENHSQSNPVNPLPIKGIFVTGSETNILKQGRKGFSGIQIENVEITAGTDGLKTILQLHLGKEINKAELTEILKDISYYYQSNKIPPVTIKIIPKKSEGTVQILILKKQKRPVSIKGFFVTNKADSILKEGRKDISDIQLQDLQLPGAEEGLKGIIHPFIGKEMIKSELSDLQKQIIQFYRTQHLPPIGIRVFTNKKSGVVQILISPKKKKPRKINGIYLTNKEENILEGGRKDLLGVQIEDIQIPEGVENLKTLILPFIGKEITKEQLSALQKQIIQFYTANKYPPISIKIAPKKAGGVVQILIKKKIPAKKGAVKGKKEGAKPKKPEFIKGIYVTSNAELLLKEGRPNFEGVQGDELFVPIKQEYFQDYLSPFIGKEINPKELKELKKKIIQYFHRDGAHFNLHVEFKIKNGVIQAYLTQKRVGKITYTGTEWMSEHQIAHIFNIHEGELIDKEKIRNHFSWLNQNAFHRSKIKFTPSKEHLGDVDVKLTTKDRFPLRFTLSGDNTGTPSIGREKIAAGVTWGNAFWQDDVLSYDFSMSNIPERYYSHTGNYLTYLPWMHKFSIFGNYSHTRPGIPNVRNIAFSNQVRVRYTIPYKPLYTPLKQSIAFGFDLKYGNSNSLNLRNPNAVVVIKKGQISQLVGNYTYYNTTKKHNMSLILNAYYSPGRIFAHQSKEVFEKRRHLSQIHYAYFNLALTDIYELPKKFALASALTVQKATTTLPGSELFGIGGYNTVRGYRPYEFSSDNGLIANLELRTPPIKPLKYFNKKVDDSLFFLCFVDYGIGYNYNHTVSSPTLPKDRKEEWALGTGFGLRYQIQQYLSFRCDYGFKCHHMSYLNKAEKRQRGGNGELHMGLLLSY